MEKKKIYITTTLPYVNAEPHIGHALEFVQADAIARYFRSKLGNQNVFLNVGENADNLTHLIDTIFQIYLRSSYQDRVDFLRGIFDVKAVENDYRISDNYQFNQYENIRRILLSLGIINSIKKIMLVATQLKRLK